MIQSNTGETVSKSITFDTPFPSIPSIIVSAKTGNPDKRLVAANPTGRNGFTINLHDYGESGEVYVDWIAIGR